MRSDENGRSEDAGVLAHTYMEVKRCPIKGPLWCAGEWINRGRKRGMKRVKYKMNRALGRSTTLLT